VGRFRGWVQVASGFAIVLGVVVTSGWLLGLAAFERTSALGSMKLNTALVVTLLGVALWLSIDGPANRPIARTLAFVAVAIAAATLFEYALDIELGIDELFRRDRAATGAPGRMSPVTASCVVALGVAIAWLETRPADALALLAALGAHVAVLGHLYGVTELYAIGPFNSVSLHTATALYALALGVLLARPQRGLMRLVASESPGGVLARRLLPAAIVLPAVLAVARQWGEEAGLYGAGLGRALLVASTSVLFVVLIARTAGALARADHLRRAAEDAVRERETYLARGNDRLRVLAEVSSTFAAVATSYQALLDRIARTIADVIGDGCSITLLSADGEQLANAGNAHRDPALEADYRAYLAGLAVSKITSPSVSAGVARTGEPRRADISPEAMVAASEDALKPLVARLSVHSFAVVPIRVGGSVIGTLSLLRSQANRGYTGDDVTLLQDLADRAGMAIEIARLHEQLEQRVRDRTAALETANQELEAFSYSVAHDLRSPLRGIAGFSRALRDDYSAQLDAEGMEYLTRIEAGAQRMAHLIDALLDLARISRAELHRKRVDLSTMARAVLARLQVAQPAREVEIVVEDGLTADADPRLLEIVLTNLLDNAWKFTSKRAHARIELATRGASGTTTFVVRDNGAGFEPRYLGKLFGVFERLHTVHEFEGTGIGLAIAKRIIHRHGGEIWAEGGVDRGATFFFTLAPVQPMRDSRSRGD